jgi:two-component system, NtrC family, nitrogen regulation response regulator GlnG
MHLKLLVAPSVFLGWSFSVVDTVQAREREARVLFADDDPEVRAAFARTARSSGWVVDLAADGEEALGLAAERSYVVVATDHQMPKLCGEELVARLRELQPKAAFVMVTGHSELAVASTRTPGVLVVISKPWNNEVLLSILAAAACQS